MSTIKDVKLAELGSEEVAWAARQMLVLEEIRNDFSKNKQPRLTLIIFWYEIVSGQSGIQRKDMEII